ncbi:hypothetical protein M3J09_003410 [Ascochyta lentis]
MPHPLFAELQTTGRHRKTRAAEVQSRQVYNQPESMLAEQETFTEPWAVANNMSLNADCADCADCP